MFRTLTIITFLLAALAGCTSTPDAASAPTAIPFPTVTPGRLVRGILSLQPLGADSASLANPATAVALASQPTAAPDTAACPVENPDLTLPTERPASQEISTAIEQFLSDGGTVSALTSGLRENWLVIGDTGFVQSDADLTGEGSPDILVSYSGDDGGTLLVLGCIDGVYQTRYTAITGGDAPELLWLGDVNVNSSPEVVFSNRVCPPDVTPAPDETDERCTYRTQLISWDTNAARFVSLLPGTIEGEAAPTVTDMDNDRVLEVVSLITSDGTAETGPQRTGVNIWDWNGSIYTLSIVQRDPPRYRIQVIHEADRVFNTLDIAQSIPLYEVALNDSSLREWIDGDDELLGLYIQYKLMLAYAYLEDERFLTSYQTITTAFPDPATRPVYAALADTFWNAMQVTNNLHSACLEVRDIIEQRPEALSRLNSYGSRSPSYTAENLCPF